MSRLPHKNLLSLTLNVTVAVTLSTIGFTFPATAEVYRWVDANGKVHFSDRKPSAEKAEEISEQLKNTNVDSSQQEQEKLGKIFAKETEAERAEREREAAIKHNNQVKKENACKKLEKRIKILSGRTYWSDGKGKEWNMTLEEQKNALAKAQAEYNQYCR